MAGKTILVIPDAHAHPDYDNARFDLLSEFINDLRPDAIVCLGDFADMASLSHYDRGRLTGEGRRYSADVAVTRDALTRINAKWSRARNYNPKMLMIEGNHEERIKRAVNEDPKMHGTISKADLGFEEHGWRTADFKVPMTYAGWTFAHYMPNGRGFAMGGENLPRALIKRWHTSIVVGHNHKLAGPYSEDKPDGKKVTAISAGCFVHPKAEEDWNAGTFGSYWIGLTVIRGAVGGQFAGIDFVSLDELTEKYS